MNEWVLHGRAQLSAGGRQRVLSLQRACEAAEPLDLKLELDESDPSGESIHFVAEAGGEVIGYAGITPDREPEACGMVHPNWRRRGAGTELLNQVRAAGRRLHRDSVMFICEDSAPTALAWMRRIGATDDSAEARMTVRLDTAAAPADRGAGPPLALRPPVPDDRDALIGLLSEPFPESAQHIGERVDDTSGIERLVALDGQAVVGALRITTTSRRSMIYGFVVVKELRGQRLGTRMLAATFERLRARGVAEVGLEVDPANTPAVRLYTAFGFETVTTYRYLRMSTA